MTDHPRFGNCPDPTCPNHGVCHCGCGRPTVIPAKTNMRWQRIRGVPTMYVEGHHPNSRRGYWGPHPNAYSKVGVPRERVVPLLRWLIGRYGWVETSRLLGYRGPGSIGRILNGSYRTVHPRVAANIARVVLEHRRNGLRSMWDVEPRTIPPTLRAAPMEPRRRGSCGTDTGYKLHRQHGEWACDPCMDAHRTASLRRRSA